MSQQVPIELVVAAFTDEHSAEAALKALKAAKKENLIGIQGAAVLRRDKKNKIHVKDINDVGGGRGALVGAAFGAGLALVTAGAGVVLAGAVGALVGGLTANAVHLGLPRERLAQLADGLKPETSAIVAVIEHKWVQQLADEFAEAGASVLTEALKADIAAQLDAGKTVAYSAKTDGESTSFDRMAGNEEMVELENITTTADGISAQATVMTADGVVAKTLSLTDKGLTTVEAVAVEAGVVANVTEVTEAGVVSGTVVAANVDEAAEETDHTDNEKAADA